MEHATAVLDTVASTWPDVTKHIFDSIWATVGTAVGAFLAGWLLINKPRFMKKQNDPTR